MAKLESSLKNMVLSLSLISLVVAAVLGGVYTITKEPIKQADEKNRKEAISNVLPAFESIKNDTISIPDTVNGKPQTTKMPIFKAYDKNNQYVGVAVQTSTNGFGGEVNLMIGFDKENNITGYAVLKHSETPGLGAKMGDWFQKSGKGNVIGKNPVKKELQVRKDGGDVDEITAATISSRAFLNGVNKAAKACNNSETNTNGSNQPCNNIEEANNAK